jgi:hypothetical protein
MEKDKKEELLIKSLDAKLSNEERSMLMNLLEHDHEVKRYSRQYEKLRQMLLRPEPDSFGPFFAERIVNKIKNLKKEIDYQIFFFFKRYQLAAVGIVIALIVLNIIFSDQLTLKSVLGLEEQNQTATDLVENVDLYSELSN